MGIGFFGLLTIVFIALKLIGVVKWSWLWILAPLWIPLAIAIFLLFVVLLIHFSEFIVIRKEK